MKTVWAGHMWLFTIVIVLDVSYFHDPATYMNKLFLFED